MHLDILLATIEPCSGTMYQASLMQFATSQENRATHLGMHLACYRATPAWIRATRLGMNLACQRATTSIDRATHLGMVIA